MLYSDTEINVSHSEQLDYSFNEFKYNSNVKTAYLAQIDNDMNLYVVTVIGAAM